MPVAVRLQTISENTSGYEFTAVVSGLDQNPQAVPYINAVQIYKGTQELISTAETISTQAALPPGPPGVTVSNETVDSVELAITTGSPAEKVSLLYAPAGSTDYQVMGGLMSGNLTIPDLTAATNYAFMAFTQTSGGTSPVVLVNALTAGTAPVVSPSPPVVPT